MDGFTYHNIFETKGQEYILIIVFLLLLIPFWFYLFKSKQVKAKVKQLLNFLSVDNLKIPKGLFFGKNHTWAFMEKNGTVSLGLDDFLIQTAGLESVRPEKLKGEKLNKGDILAKLVNKDKNLKIYSPVTGIVTETNQNIIGNPDLLYNDPYYEGWLVKVDPLDWKNDTKHLLLKDESVKWEREELSRFKDFIVTSVNKYSFDRDAVILQDGGEIIAKALEEMPREIWSDFQNKFLNI